MKKVWIEYEWQHGGHPSVTYVDGDFYSDYDAQDQHPILAGVTISPKNAFGGEGTAMDLFTVSMKRAKVLKAGKNALFVAEREIGARVDLFFYCQGELMAEEIAKECVSKTLECVCELRVDQEWSVYYGYLYPNQAQGQTIENEKIIAKLSSKKDNSQVRRRINHHVGFLDEISRMGFEEAAKEAGFAIGDSYYTCEFEYPSCACVHNMGTTDKLSVDEYTTRVITTAEKFGGRYMYWDCKLVRKQ